jgi:hypothetical protein
MRFALTLLVGIGLGFGVGWFVFGSSEAGSGLTRPQAEQAVMRDGEYDAAECETSDDEFSCKVFLREFGSNALKQTSTVRVFERNGRAVTEDSGGP